MARRSVKKPLPTSSGFRPVAFAIVIAVVDLDRRAHWAPTRVGFPPDSHRPNGPLAPIADGWRRRRLLGSRRGSIRASSSVAHAKFRYDSPTYAASKARLWFATAGRAGKCERPGSH